MKKTSVSRKTSAAARGSKVRFTLSAQPGCKVYVAGSFNDWDPTRNRMRFNKHNGVYSTSAWLAPGSYEYKFIVDDEWLVDPSCENWVYNDFNTLNSVLTVS